MRGAIDIGSGSTKLLVARVDVCKQVITNLIYEAQRSVDFKEDLQRSKDNTFSTEITKKAISVLNELNYLATKQGASKLSAVATSAFRTASNAKETLDEILKNIDFKVMIISQKQEALFAYHSALNIAKTQNLIGDKPVAVWDIGGGSMQIIKSYKDTKTQPVIYLGKMASVSFKNSYLEMRNGDKKTGPNPLQKDGAIEAMNLARNYANKDAKELLGDLTDYTVLGVGGVHYYSVRKQTGINNEYDQQVLLQTLLKRAKLNDKEIGGDFAKTDVTNLALVLGFMQSLKVEKVHPIKVNMTHGLLLATSLWK
ncbi:Ppx/GppA phosphatase domain protein [Bacteriovorax sp. Seq25_V]|nr:Ppx/GppA phosphatase domain protein [Bacteriovorax sp. Seq25_V]